MLTMTQEDKNLLLRDLSARLSYGVIVKYKSREKEGNVKITYGNIGYVAELGKGWWIDCKPYLRPMSSMTEEERKERLSSFFQIVELNSGLTPLLSALKSFEYIDWLNSHHFDYHGFIEKSLAIEAPEGMYDLKEK